MVEAPNHVERLRHWLHCFEFTREHKHDLSQAANHIEALERQIAELRAGGCDPDGCKAHIDAFMARAEAAEAREARLIEALERLANWPSGGNTSGQTNMEKFARTALSGSGAGAGDIGWEVEVDDGCLTLRSDDNSITVHADTAIIFNAASGKPARKVTLNDSLILETNALFTPTGSSGAGGWRFAVKDSDGRTWLELRSPSGATALLSCATNHAEGETIASQVLHQFALTLPAAPTGEAK